MSLYTFSSSPKQLAFGMIGLCIATLVLLLMISEIFLRFIVMPADNFYKHMAFYDTIDKVDVVAFGDSHMSQGFFSENLNMANLAYASENFEQIATKISYFLKDKQTDKILLQVSHHMFADYRFDDSRRDYNLYFAPEAAWKNRLRLQDPVLRGNLLNYWTVFFVAVGKIPNLSSFKETGTVIIDDTMEYPPTGTQFSYRKKRTKEHTLRRSYKDHLTWEILRSTIRRIKDQNIKLCLVTLPVTDFYQETVSELPYTQEAYDRLAKIASEENVPYFFYWPDYKDQYDLFRNLDHLNLQGAKVFTKRVLEDCGF